MELTCRYGHASGRIDATSLLVYSGIDPQSYPMRSAFAYNYVDNEIVPLEESGSPPPARVSFGLLASGNGMFLLYGGASPDGEGSFSDLWHVRVHLAEKDIHYSQEKYKGDHDHYILTWRQGFTLHWMHNI